MSSALLRSSPDPFARALSQAADRVVDACRAVAAANPVVLIDGRSGAGKTTLAGLVRQRWDPREQVQSIALDDLYPGWEGLDAGADAARTSILVPHGRGLVGTWRRWDWEASAHAESLAVDPSLPLIVEGSGVLTPASARLGDVRVWVDAPETSRRRRALARDGDTYRPYWDAWAVQEQAHVDRDDPTALATLVFALP